MRANILFNPYFAAGSIAILLGSSFVWPLFTPLFALTALIATGLTTKKIIGLHGRPYLFHRLALPLALTFSSFLVILSLEHLAVRSLTVIIVISIFFRLLVRLKQEGATPLPQAARDTLTPVIALFATIAAAGAGSRTLATFLDLHPVFVVLIFTALTALAAWGAFHLHLPGGTIPKISFAIFTLLTLEIAIFVAFFPWTPLTSGTILVATVGYMFLIFADALAGQLDRGRIFLYSSASMVTLLSVLGSARWFA